VDRAGPPGHRDRWPASRLTACLRPVADDDRLRVCLERTIELEGLRMRVREWPGRRGPVVHVPDPVGLVQDAVIDSLAVSVAPRYRVLSLRARGNPSTYQVDAADVLALLDTFGFRAPVLVGEGLGCVAALIVAAWYAERVAGLVLVSPRSAAPPSETVRSLALLDCPPDLPRLHARITCPVLVEDSVAALVQGIGRFLDTVCG
jgi:pimeloyl-ACP methyl ester carboxylesterase